MDRARATLKAAFERFTDLPWPGNGQVDDELSQLHAALVGYDSYVAGLITQLIGGASEISHPLEIDTSLRQRLERVIAEGDPNRVPVAKKYLARVNEIERLVRLGEAVLASSER